MTRQLTDDEIENMLLFIKPRKGIPKDSAMSVVNIQKEKHVMNFVSSNYARK